MTPRRQTSPLTPSLDGPKERKDRHMKNKKKNTPAQRLGAAALATATVVSGLAFGPGAVAAPAASMSVTSANTPAADASTDDFGSVSALEVAATELVRGETSEL